MTTLPDTFAAVLARIEAMGEDVSDYKIITIAERIVADGVTVADVNDLDFLHLLNRNLIEDETALPCPSWCRYEPGHGFESTHTLTGVQVRPHTLVLASRDGVYMAVVQDHERQPGDDSTAVLGPVFVDVQIEGERESGAALRRLAGELLNAADKLDELTEESEL